MSLKESHRNVLCKNVHAISSTSERDERPTTLFWISEIKSTCRGDIPILVDYREIIERQKKLVASEYKSSASNLTVAFEVFALV